MKNTKKKEQFFIITIFIRDIYNNLETILNQILRESYINLDLLEDIKDKLENTIIKDKNKMKPLNDYFKKIDFNKIFIEQIKNKGQPPKANTTKKENYELLKHIFNITNEFILNNKNIHIKALYKEHEKTILTINKLLKEFNNNKYIN